MTHKKSKAVKLLCTPTLDSLIIRGLVMYSDSEHQWLAQASDGQYVMVGHNAESAEKYLSAHPNQKEW